MTEWHDFPNVKSFTMLSFPQVAEAYWLIYPRPLGENSSFVCCRNEKNPRFLKLWLKTGGGGGVGNDTP